MLTRRREPAGIMRPCKLFSRGEFRGWLRCGFGVGLAGLLQEVQVRLGVEYAITPIEKPGRVNLYAAEDLDAPALSGDRNLRLHPTPRPRRVQCGILPEGGFVAMDQRRTLRSGVFFRLG